jgi:hypothetical protein
MRPRYSESSKGQQNDGRTPSLTWAAICFCGRTLASNGSSHLRLVTLRVTVLVTRQPSVWCTAWHLWAVRRHEWMCTMELKSATKSRAVQGSSSNNVLRVAARVAVVVLLAVKSDTVTAIAALPWILSGSRAHELRPILREHVH